ncbi:putative ribonuclease H-like domain-containing protein [Tanacetum coccineum]
MKKMYCLVVTDDFSRFTWVFFLATKEETSGILKSFITGIENLVDHKVKVTRCDNGTEFKNKEINQFCEMKGIKRQFSVAKTPQQNGVPERRNRTLIEATRTMLADSKLPTSFWAEVVNTACYVQNRVLVVKPHYKTPYEPFHGRTPTLSFMRPFGCPVTILNTIDHLGKFDGRADEGFFVGYSLNSKAFRVFNSRPRIVEENLHIRFSENLPNIVGSGLDWLFDIDALTRTINYEPILIGTQFNGFAGTKASNNAGQARMETKPVKDYILLPLWTTDQPFSQGLKSSQDDGSKPSSDDGKKVDEDSRKYSKCNDQEKGDNVNSTNNVNAASTNEVNVVGVKTSIELPFDPDMLELEDYRIFEDDEDVGVEADMNNLDTSIQVSPILTTRIHKDYPLNQVIGDLQSATQTRRMSKSVEEHGFIKEPKKVIHALKDPSWIEAMQEELIQFKLQKVWTLVDLPNGKRPIGTKWVFMNKNDEIGIVIRNKARLVAQGYTQEEGINYDEVFAPVARIEAIRLFLAYASFKDFVVYQMDVKSAFIYGKIEEEVYVCQPLGFEDPDFPDRVYKVEKALYGLHKAPGAWYETLSTYLLDNEFQRGKINKTLFIKRYKGDILLVQVYVDDIIFGSTKKELFNAFENLMHEKFQMSSMGELTCFLGLQVQQKKDGIFISQDKYVDEILKKFGFTEVKTASTPIETQKPLLKDEDVCACARYQVNPKVSHLHDVKRIFSMEEIEQWLQYSTTEAEYVAASSCCGQQFWATVKAKTVIGEVQLQALVDGKKVIITESTVKRDLQLEDAEGVDCLPKAAIFEQLTLMGAKTTAWNEFSSTIASAIICLATNQKFNFSKYIFHSMVKNLDSVGNFLMYPRFVQVFLNKQVDGMSNHNGIYVIPSHTKKIFGNMKRVGKGFSGRETPLFPTIMVQAQEEMGEVDEAIYEEMDDSLERATTTATSLDAEQDRGVNIPRSDEDSLKLKELMELCTNLKNRVIDLEKTKTSQTQEITSLKRRVRRLKKKGGSRTHKLKLLYKVGLSARVESSKESLGEEDASKQGRISDIDADAGISLVSTHFDADTDMFRVHDLVGDEVIVESEVPSKDMNLSVDEVILAQALTALKSAKPKADKVVIQEPKQGTITTTTAATTIIAASTRPKAKSLVIHEEEQAPTPTPIVSLGQGALFKKTELVNYMDNFLLLNLKTMFVHHVEDSVWKNQQGLVKVLNWKLYDSCRVHCITMQSILYYLLVEKMYPLTNHTLHQMFNDVKLQVDYECEMAFELLRLVKK